MIHARDITAPVGIIPALEKLIATPELCSKRWVWEQYDHVILGNTVQRPGGDAAVVRVQDGPKGLALTVDVTPRYCEADPYQGGMQAVAEAWRNITAVGGRPLAITDNLNFGNPERPEIMGQFVGCLKGISEACRALDFPVVSGNVSLYNETNGSRASCRRPRSAASACSTTSPNRRRSRSRPRARRSCLSAKPMAGSGNPSICATSAAAKRARRRRSTLRPKSATAAWCAA